MTCRRLRFSAITPGRGRASAAYPPPQGPSAPLPPVSALTLPSFTCSRFPATALVPLPNAVPHELGSRSRCSSFAGSRKGKERVDPQLSIAQRSKIRVLTAKAAAPSQPAQSGRQAPPAVAMPCRQTGGKAMWFIPISVTLEMKRTRKSWTLVFRVQFVT